MTMTMAGRPKTWRAARRARSPRARSSTSASACRRRSPTTSPRATRGCTPRTACSASGPFPYEGDEDPNLINAGKQTVTVLPGGSTFDSASSFAMIRGGHVDLAILGAMQVSAGGDLANWAVPGGKVMGIGGAMDLASGCRRVIAMMQHVTKKDEHKLVAEVRLPADRATRVVSLVITELGVFEPTGHGFRIIELAPGVTREQAEAATGAPLIDA